MPNTIGKRGFIVREANQPDTEHYKAKVRSDGDSAESKILATIFVLVYDVCLLTYFLTESDKCQKSVEFGFRN